jgi:serine/threonine protein kinase
VSLSPALRMVLEFLEHGDLYSFLHPEVDSLHEGISQIPQQDFPWSLRIRILLDIATGMNYLQSREPPIIHRDLRSPNIFLGSLSEHSPVRAKIADFGLARFVAPTAEGALDTWEWVAPETLSGNPYTIS